MSFFHISVLLFRPKNSIFKHLLKVNNNNNNNDTTTRLCNSRNFIHNILNNDVVFIWLRYIIFFPPINNYVMCMVLINFII